MRIIIDAMGGDNAPEQIIEGVCLARDDASVNAELMLVGTDSVIRRIALEKGLSLSGIDIMPTESVIGMEESPMAIMKSKSKCSMAVGLKLLLPDNEYGVVGDAFVSAGSTGALHLGSSLIVGKLPGVKRSGIAAILPFTPPVLLMDAGANPKITEEYLRQWAVMGSIYMRSEGCENPRVGLLNNGTEEGKGTDIYVKAHELLSDTELNFVGNVESREIPFGACDVLVCDGFTGNIVLKLIEGMGRFMLSQLKQLFSTNAAAGVSFMLVKNSMNNLKNKFDSSEYGGAPLLGLRRNVIKAHGSSDARAVYNAVRQAERCVSNDITAKMEEQLARL